MVFREALVDQAKLVRLFQLIFEGYTFKDLKLPFAPVALDLASGQEVIIKDGKLCEVVMASCALPGIFPPQRGSGMVVVDGGVSDNLAIRAARSVGARVVLSVFLGGPLPPAGALNSGLQISLRGDQIARAKLQQELLKEAEMVINPKVFGLHWADFRKFDYCLAQGESAVKEKLPEIRRVTSRLYYLGQMLRPRFGPRY
jgi:NTE family protein